MGISTYDVDNFDREVDERIEGWSNLGNNYTELLTEDGNMVSSDVFNVDDSCNKHLGRLATQVTLLGVVQRQQEQITKLDKSMRLIFERNRKLDDEVFNLKIALRDSAKAFNNLFACCGVKIILDFTLLLGTPGIILTKSTTNSDAE